MASTRDSTSDTRATDCAASLPVAARAHRLVANRREFGGQCAPFECRCLVLQRAISDRNHEAVVRLNQSPFFELIEQLDLLHPAPPRCQSVPHCISAPLPRILCGIQQPLVHLIHITYNHVTEAAVHESSSLILNGRIALHTEQRCTATLNIASLVSKHSLSRAFCNSRQGFSTFVCRMDRVAISVHILP